MKITRNNGISDDNIVQNRFTAYLKISIAHQKAKYLAGIYERQKQEVSYEEHSELFDRMQDDSADTYFDNEIGNEQLCHALDKLKERDRMIVLRRAVSGESFVKIAEDMGISQWSISMNNLHAEKCVCSSLVFQRNVLISH